MSKADHFRNLRASLYRSLIKALDQEHNDLELIRDISQSILELSFLQIDYIRETDLQ